MSASWTTPMWVLLLGVLQTYAATYNNEIQLVNYTAPDDPLVVCYSSGCVRGITQPGYQIDEYEAFLGVPYAKPPVGPLRFANPVKINPWNGVLDTIEAKTECIQKNYLLQFPQVAGKEDCLYLNLYRPTGERRNLTDQPLLPVMVFIHGGGFFAGSANPSFVGPQYFMDTSDVIMVVMAYRLGAMGFLSTGDHNSPGNFGLKDQNLAMLWVKENIEAFGGDNTAITLFGVSAGAASVQMHMMSPLSKNLFHRAIVMSGCATASYNVPYRQPLEQVRKQAALLGIANAGNVSTASLVRSLRSVDAVKLTDSGDGLRYWSVDPLTEYRTVVEPQLAGAFLVEDPKDILNRGDYMKVPWLTGIVQNEGAVRSAAIISNQTLLDELNLRFDEILPKLVTFEKQSPDMARRIADYYFDGQHHLNSERNRQQFMNIFSDIHFLYPFYKSLETHVRTTNTVKYPVYLYRFAYRGPVSYSPIYTGTLNDFGVVHQDDTIYLFRSDWLPEFKKDSAYAEVVRKMVDTYVSFAKYGTPTMWSPVKNCTKYHSGPICEYQNFGNSAEDPTQMQVSTSSAFDLSMIRFWDSFAAI